MNKEHLVTLRLEDKNKKLCKSLESLNKDLKKETSDKISLNEENLKLKEQLRSIQQQNTILDLEIRLQKAAATDDLDLFWSIYSELQKNTENNWIKSLEASTNSTLFIQAAAMCNSTKVFSYIMSIIKIAVVVRVSNGIFENAVDEDGGNKVNSVEYINSIYIDEQGQTPLHIAMNHHSFDVARLFLCNEGSYCWFHQDKSGRTPFHLILRQPGCFYDRDGDLCRLFSDVNNINFSARFYREDRFILHTLKDESNRTIFFTLLLAEKMNNPISRLAFQNFSGFSSWLEYYNCISDVLKIDKEDRIHKTEKERDEIYRLIIYHCMDRRSASSNICGRDDRGLTLLHIAIENNDSYLIRELRVFFKLTKFSFGKIDFLKFALSRNTEGLTINELFSCCSDEDLQSLDRFYYINYAFSKGYITVLEIFEKKYLEKLLENYRCKKLKEVNQNDLDEHSRCNAFKLEVCYAYFCRSLILTAIDGRSIDALRSISSRIFKWCSLDQREVERLGLDKVKSLVDFFKKGMDDLDSEMGEKTKKTIFEAISNNCVDIFNFLSRSNLRVIMKSDKTCYMKYALQCKETTFDLIEALHDLRVYDWSQCYDGLTEKFRTMREREWRAWIMNEEPKIWKKQLDEEKKPEWTENMTQKWTEAYVQNFIEEKMKGWTAEKEIKWGNHKDFIMFLRTQYNLPNQPPL